MPRTFRGSLRRTALLFSILAASFGLFATTPDAGQTGPLASAAAASQVTPIAVHSATVNLISTRFRTDGVALVTRGKGPVQGSGAPWRVQHAGRTLNSKSSHYPWVCFMCHLPSFPNG